jgi:transposase InsO family protein
VRAFIDAYRETFGVESICQVLQVAPSGYWRYAARQRHPALKSARERRDEAVIPHIEHVWHANMQIYGADKVWKQLRREGCEVARCTVERLMRQRGLQGAVRGKRVRTTNSDKAVPCRLTGPTEPSRRSAQISFGCRISRTCRLGKDLCMLLLSSMSSPGALSAGGSAVLGQSYLR